LLGGGHEPISEEEAKLFTLLPSKGVKLAALHLFLGKTAIKFQQFAVSHTLRPGSSLYWSPTKAYLLNKTIQVGRDSLLVNHNMEMGSKSKLLEF
jgi:hypothetical protein